MDFRDERREIAEERRKLEREKQEFLRHMELEERRREQEKKLFDMKMKILEEELVKLASEKEYIEKQKAFYSKVNDYERTSKSQDSSRRVVKGDMFFSGVGSKVGLRKRYRDLIKIYHPDNVDGDNNTIQEINREYNNLSKMFG